MLTLIQILTSTRIYRKITLTNKKLLIYKFETLYANIINVDPDFALGTSVAIKTKLLSKQTSIHKSLLYSHLRNDKVLDRPVLKGPKRFEVK